MALNRPTLPNIIDRVATDIEAALVGTDARLRRANTTVLGRAIAGTTHGLYGFAEQQANQYIITSSTGSILERWAAVWKIARKSATHASGTAVIAGIAGTVLPSGSVLSRADSAEFTTREDAEVGLGGTATVALVASEAGAGSNTAGGTVLAVAAQVDGLNATASVSAAGLTGGSDAELDAALRARLLERIQNPPQGGADADYAQWALEVADVTRVWVYPRRMGAGTVGVAFVCDNLDDIIPTPAKVAEVQAYIDSPARKPVTAEVYVFAPLRYTVDFTISVTPNTEAVRAAVRAELEDLFAREAEPETPIFKTHYDEAISAADGETDHLVTVPAGNIQPSAGAIPALGVITWV